MFLLEVRVLVLFSACLAVQSNAIAENEVKLYLFIASDHNVYAMTANSLAEATDAVEELSGRTFVRTLECGSGYYVEWKFEAYDRDYARRSGIACNGKSMKAALQAALSACKTLGDCLGSSYRYSRTFVHVGKFQQPKNAIIDAAEVEDYVTENDICTEGSSEDEKARCSIASELSDLGLY